MTSFRGVWGAKLLCGCLLVLFCVHTAAAQEGNRKVLKQVEAEYPRVLKKMEIGGVVKLKVIIKADGAVESSEVLGGNPILASEAQKAIMQWKFAPASASSTAEIKFTFDPHK